MKNFIQPLLKLKKRMLIWGLGRTADAAILNFTSMFLLYYYNQILGLEPFYAGIALALATLTDAITDPVIGLYSDYQKMKGKNRTSLMKISTIPCAVVFICLFSFDFGKNQGILFGQLFILTVLLRFFLTLFVVPREAIGVQIFDGYGERNKLWALNAFFGVFGASLALGPTLLFFITDWENKSGYLVAAIWIAAIYTICAFLCAIFVQNEEASLKKGFSKVPEFSMHAVFSEILILMKNRSWLMLFLGCVVFSIQAGLTTGTGLYFNNFLWRWQPNDLFWGGIFSLPGSVLGALIIIYFQVPDKKRLAIKLGILATITTPILLSCRIIEIYFSIDLLPHVGNGAFSALWWLWVAQQFIENFIWTMFWILIASMFSDTVEEQELLTGSRLDGIILSANNFINKTLLSTGILFSGFLLTLVGFNKASDTMEKTFAAYKLGLFSLSTVLLLFPISLYFISKYEITNAKHQKNLKDLNSFG